MNKAISNLLETIDLQEAMRRRAVQESITLATATHWDRRAAVFDAVAARPGDYVGRDPVPTNAAEISLACRHHAALLRGEVG